MPGYKLLTDHTTTGAAIGGIGSGLVIDLGRPIERQSDVFGGPTLALCCHPVAKPLPTVGCGCGLELIDLPLEHRSVDGGLHERL